MDQLFDAFAAPGSLRMTWRSRGFPAVNVWEDTECLYAEAEVPGVSKDDIDIQVQGDELTIKGKRKPMDEDDSVYHRRERGTGDFARFLTLPVEINASKVDATLNNGVLLLTLPKAASARPKQITVKAK
jgi:HSP20 family protein